ncbi:metallophosphoesterase [Acidobacteria bacterium AH-259-O06]|nr:metallophosphoesterase [Acidobacteria bacterium AH-259-O06]
MTACRQVLITVCLAWLVAALGLLPVLAEQTPVVRFAVIGDGGTGDKHQRGIARQMLAWHNRLPYDLTLMLGDNIYGGFFGLGGGNKKDFEKKFDRPYADLLARGVTFRAALGNHDMRHRDGLDLIEAHDRFHIDGEHGYYSFTAGESASGAPLLEFLVLNTERLKNGDLNQILWLAEALAASQARWRIVYGHHPLYSTGKRHGGEDALRQQLEPLFVDSDQRSSSKSFDVGFDNTMSAPQVHVVLAGHDHIYERFHPQKGVVYFVCGSSGKLNRNGARRSPDLAAVEDQQRIFMLWEATPEELRFRAINVQGQAFDCGIIRGWGQPETVSCSVLIGSR